MYLISNLSARLTFGSRLTALEFFRRLFQVRPGPQEACKGQPLRGLLKQLPFVEATASKHWNVATDNGHLYTRVTYVSL